MSPAAGVPAAQSGEIVNATAATTSVPSEVKGDWVLFHPVYSQEELRSVEVSLEIFDSFFGLSSNLPFRRLGGARELILTDILIYLGLAPSSQNVLR